MGVKQLVKSWIMRRIDAALIVGTGRCGTTFIADYLNQAHSDDVLSLHEPHPRFIGIHALENDSKSDQIVRGRGKIALSVWLRNRLNQGANSNLYVESNCHLALGVGEFVKCWRNCKVIVVVRDYRECIMSLASMDLGKGQYFFSDFDHQNGRRPTAVSEGFMTAHDWQDLSRIEKIAWFWVVVNGSLLNYAKNNSSSTLVLDFDDLKLSKVQFVQNITEFLGLRLFEVDGVSARENSSSDIGQRRLRWDDLPDEMKDKVDAICENLWSSFRNSFSKR